MEEAIAHVSLPYGLEAKGPAPDNLGGFQKYDSLNADHASPFVRPLLTVSVPETGLKNIRDRHFSELASAIGMKRDDLDLKSVQIFVYDNTIAMAQFDLELAASHVDETQFLAHFDTLTTLAGKTFVNEIAGPVVQQLALQLSRITLPGSTKKTILIPPDRFVAFDDVAFDGTYEWPTNHSALLWVNRTMSITNVEKGFHETAAAWARLNGQTKHALAQDHYISIKPGNNLLINDDGAEDLLAALRMVQFFYIIFDTFSDRLKRFYVSIGPDRNDNTVGKMHRRAARISAFSDFARAEFNDLMIGLQSERKAFAETLVDVFEMEQLIANVRDKHVAVDAKIAALFEMRGQKRQKLLQVGIVMIGALQIFDLLLNISWFSLTEPHLVNDGVPGIFDIGQLISPNMLQWVAFVIVLMAAIALTNRRRT